MKEKRFLFPVLAVVLLSLTDTTFGQTPAPTTSSGMVYVPVAVTGPKNVNVSGLTKDNFVLLENGIQQTISAFYEQNQPIDIDFILALSALQRGRADLNSTKIREGIENFRQQSNPQNKYVLEEMPFGANGIYEAIDRHITRLAERSVNPRKIVLALTDGFESSGGEPGRALQEYARKLDVAIYIIYTEIVDASAAPDGITAMGRGRGMTAGGGAIYEDLTRFTGGQLFHAEHDTQLVPFLQTLAANLKNQYVLGFKSTNDARDDKWRKLEVKIKAPAGVGTIKEKDMKTKVRDRYFVAKPAKP